MGDGKAGGITFPNPETCKEKFGNIEVISLAKLIDMKLASHRSLPVHRAKDLADVVELIKCRKLDKSYADQLHPSNRTDFIELITGLEQEAASDDK